MSRRTIRTYDEMIQFSSFEDRFEYLRLDGQVGDTTFGFDRYMNQMFYRSTEWKQARHRVIARDYGLDLGVDGYEIYDKVLVHHMNPMVPKDIEHGSLDILDERFLITVSHETHNAIHYGDARQLRPTLVERRPNDTAPWLN